MSYPPLDGKVAFVSRRLTRKRKALMIMLVPITLLFLFHYWIASAMSFPSKINGYSTNTPTFSSIDSDRERLLLFVNSSANRVVFSQLKDGTSSFYDSELNVLGTVAMPQFNSYQQQPYVANGYIGARIPNLGQGFTYDQLSDGSSHENLLNGWPLFNKRYAGAFIAGFYNIEERLNATNFPELYADGYESVIAGVPQWTTLTVSTIKDGITYTLNPSMTTLEQGTVTNYAQNLSLSNGIVTTEFTWLNSTRLKFQIIAHRDNINLGVVHFEAQNLLNSSIELTVEDSLSFHTSQRCQLKDTGADSNGIYINFNPNQLSYVNATIYSHLDTDSYIQRDTSEFASSQSVILNLDPYDNAKLTKYVGIYSSDLDTKIISTFSRAKKVAISQGSSRRAISTHVSAWADTLGKSIDISFKGDRLLTLASRSSIYHLAANTRPDAQGVSAAMPVGGLSSDSYAGMVFWDADLWMMNGILPFLPSHARSFVNYRTHLHEQARKNVPKGYGGAVYPWTSGRFGNCTSTGPCLDYEYHINMAVAQSAWQIYLSGAADDIFLKEIAYPLITDAATFFADYVVKYNQTLGKFTTHNMTDPDEYANHVDNGAYTNAGISAVMKWALTVGSHLGMPVVSNFQDIAGNVLIPMSDNADRITLEYTGMNSSVAIKQADVIMMTYPLNNELIDNEQAYTNMEFYSAKQVNFGPAMTYPIFSIVASNLAVSGCASQSYLRKGVVPFLRAPFAQFSEQNQDDFLTNGGTHPAFPFMTAHGGFLQSAVQGLTGLRFDFEVLSNGRVQRVLTLDPVAIPCLGDHASYNGITYDNHSLSFEVNSTHFTVANNGPASQAKCDAEYVRIKVGSRNEKAGTYTLYDGDTFSFPLYAPEKTYMGSISECQGASFVNITEGAFGDATVSVNDGDNTTHWQAQSNCTVSKILIDLHEFKNISSGLINWGNKPAKSLTLSSSKSDSFDSVEDILSMVDFGNSLYKQYYYANPTQDIHKQQDIFEVVLREKVSITAPFDAKEYAEIAVPDRYNITTFEFTNAIESRFLLLEVEGIHNTEPIESDIGGAKLYEVVFY